MSGITLNASIRIVLQVTEPQDETRSIRLPILKASSGTLSRTDTDQALFHGRFIMSESTTLSKLNCMPFISTFSGGFGAFLSLVQTIKYIVIGIFRCHEECFEKALYSSANLLRNLVAMVPLAGNFTIFAIDYFREKATKKGIENHYRHIENQGQPQWVLYDGIKEVARCGIQPQWTQVSSRWQFMKFSQLEAYILQNQMR